ncbi:unnamed protein product [Diatraea saccharalis]|uniref:Uncharacterized protein n=1 Tax=Diatraea saccharalis TaxID=40085 RepID=A0A9N9WGG2_9NEOP|nr:unnamed protein product [Diatraea saccharalis]
MTAITQYKILNWKFVNLKLRPSEANYDKEEQEVILKDLLNMNLKHYDAVLRYREGMEKLLSQFIFAHLGNSALSLSIAMALAAKSENLVFSAYCSDWISRPESFKRSLRLLMQHANKPFILTGFKTAKLSVVTFTSVIFQ